MLRQPPRLSEVSSLHPQATTATDMSVISVQHLRSSVVRSLHEANATTAASVMLVQRPRSSVVSSLHFEASHRYHRQVGGFAAAPQVERRELRAPQAHRHHRHVGDVVAAIQAERLEVGGFASHRHHRRDGDGMATQVQRRELLTL